LKYFFYFFIFFHSTFDVGRSMFDVHLFSENLPQSPSAKNNSALMGLNPEAQKCSVPYPFLENWHQL